MGREDVQGGSHCKVIGRMVEMQMGCVCVCLSRNAFPGIVSLLLSECTGKDGTVESPNMMGAQACTKRLTRP